MARHSRMLINTSIPASVAGMEVAPHRYTLDRDDDIDNTPGAIPFRDWFKAQPYQVGDVVFVVCGEGYARAYISGLGVDRDRYDDRRAKYRVHRETKKGTWSKIWYWAHPGQIQRGYQRAGAE